MPDYGPETRLARATDTAIARHNRDNPPRPAAPLCGVDGCPLPAGHVESAGSDHLPPIVDRRESTSVRHVRVGDESWRAAARRAKRDGYGVAKAVRALVDGYAAGTIDLPPTTTTDTAESRP